jgi:hypothetical protein
MKSNQTKNRRITSNGEKSRPRPNPANQSAPALIPHQTLWNPNAHAKTQPAPCSATEPQQIPMIIQNQ